MTRSKYEWPETVLLQYIYECHSRFIGKKRRAIFTRPKRERNEISRL